MSPAVVVYTIFPFVRKNENWRESFLSDKGLISINKDRGFFEVLGFIFYFSGKLPVADIISVVLFKNNLIKTNFIENPYFCLEGPYETDKVYVKEGDFVFDIGANIGLFSIISAKQTGPLGKVFSFEPILETRKILEKNYRSNNLNNFTILPLALGEKNEDVFFLVNQQVLGDSRKILTNESDNIEQVKQKTLDSIILNEKITKVDFIKADIEGMERFFLQGAKETIKKFKPKMAICIYHLKDDPEVIEKIILEYEPNYKIYKTNKKLFAWYE